jgi:hypothetical protein
MTETPCPGHDDDVSVDEEHMEPDLSDTSGSVKGGSNGNEESAAIAHKETKAVGRLKLVVLAVLIVSAVAVSITVHSYIKKSEEKVFVGEFADDANKVLESIGSTIDKTLRAFDSVEVAFQTIVAATNQTWPFVTIPNFARIMANVLALSDAIHIDLIPVVDPSLRDEWEEYASTHNDWLNEAMAVQEDYGGYYGPIVYNATYERVIHDDDGPIPKHSRYVAMSKLLYMNIAAAISYLTLLAAGAFSFPSGRIFQ